jgi:hypothetical protein
MLDEKMIQSMGDTDLVWQKNITVEPTTLITYFQGEQGFASFVACSGLVGESEPICKIFSKLHNVEPINTVPSPSFPEWRMYEMYNSEGRRYFVLRMSSTYVVNNDKTKAWLYNYPVMRDIVLALNKVGVEEMVYLTTNIMQEFMYQDTLQLPDDELLVYDYNFKDEELFFWESGEEIKAQMILPPPSWMFAEVFQNFSDKNTGNFLVVSSNTTNTFVNQEAVNTVVKFLTLMHRLKVDKTHMLKVSDALLDIEGFQPGE